MTPFGLGAIQSPPDEQDFPLAFSPEELATVLPASFTVKNRPPILNQHTTPQCVAFSAAGEQASFDMTDLGHTYRWDTSLFFRQIGGTVNGAVIRNAFDRRLHRGYPLLPAGSGNSASSHRISAYYAVPLVRDSIKRALIHYGPVVFGTPWFNSWFHPHQDGTLPPADYQVGGHAIEGDAYDPYGVWLPNTWGTDYGVNGRVHVSWYVIEHTFWECWKALDQKTGGG